MLLIKYIRLPFQFDTLRMQQEVNNLSSQHWQLHYQTLQYSGSWTAIPLRSINGDAGNVIVSPEESAVYADTVFLKQSPYFKEVLSAFHCPMKAVRLLKLDAGAEIKEHRDAELAFEHGEIRVHIPVHTNDGVEFFLDKERINLKEGECWYMNFNLPHSVHNKSTAPRIHLVIDAVVNDWVRSLFAQPGLFKMEMEETRLDDITRRRIIEQLRQLGTETATRMADEMEMTYT